MKIVACCDWLKLGVKASGRYKLQGNRPVAT